MNEDEFQMGKSQHLMFKVGSVLYTNLYSLLKRLNINTGLRGRLGGGFLDIFLEFSPRFFSVQELENLFGFEWRYSIPHPKLKHPSF